MCTRANGDQAHLAEITWTIALPCLCAARRAWLAQQPAVASSAAHAAERPRAARVAAAATHAALRQAEDGLHRARGRRGPRGTYRPKPHSAARATTASRPAACAAVRLDNARALRCADRAGAHCDGATRTATRATDAIAIATVTASRGELARLREGECLRRLHMDDTATSAAAVAATARAESSRWLPVETRPVGRTAHNRAEVGDGERAAPAAAVSRARGGARA
eukprot:scaffold9170_cov28-Tisochrysis_lutea.AAC.4